MKKFALLAILLVFPFQSLAICSTEGYTVIYVNGIFTSEKQAKQEQDLLQSNWEKFTGRTDVKFLPGYNPTHLGGAGDLLKSIQQAYKNEDSYINDFDLQTILLKVEPDVKTRKILLFGYSQGTFYTNALYNYLVANGVPKESITVYNVGTPASYVGGDGKYLTSANDLLIKAVREKSALGNAKQPLDANILIPPVEENPTPSYPGHSFKNVYLPKATGRIIGEVNAALDTLTASAPSEGGCFTPPPVTGDYKIKQASFAFFDPAATKAMNGAMAFFEGMKYAINTAEGGLDAVGSAIRSLLPKADTATAIEAFDVVRNVYGSSVSKEDLLELNASAPSVKTVAKKPETAVPPQPHPYMDVVAPTTTPKLSEGEPNGEVLGEFIAAPPPPLFAPATPNGPLIGGGGGGGGAAPAPEPAATPTPDPVPVAPAPVSELFISAPTDAEIVATTTVTVSGTAPVDTQIEISDGTTTATTTSDGAGAWTTDFSLAEGAVTLTVSAFETALNATTTLTRSFTITLPCVEPSAALPATGQIDDLNETWTEADGPYVIEGDVYVRSGTISMGPGTVVKFKPGAMLTFHADVTVNIAGALGLPVIFTSIKDDSAGEDTNCDDAATSPAPGDWGYASFGSGARNRNLSLSYLKAQYGGGVAVTNTYDGSFFPALMIFYQKFSGSSGVDYSLSNLEISESAGTGLYLYIGMDNGVTLSNSSFHGNASGGLLRAIVFDLSGHEVAGDLIAANNWWGDISGPFHTILNPTGAGNAVAPTPSQYETITISPWLTAAP